MNTEIRQIQEQVKEKSELTTRIMNEIRKVIVGQDHLVESLLISFFSNGHILLEGVPGLAKTLAIKTLASAIRTKFARIQFTPDLLPADLVGTRIFNQKTVEFETSKGPVFTNFLLADEINRAPAKVQSALLESMEERQVTIEKQTFKLDEPFLVMATQNPIETEGTYQLSEAQVDRFMLKVNIGYPQPADEIEIVRKMAIEKNIKAEIKVDCVTDPAEMLAARALIDKIYVDDNILKYVIDVVNATRTPAKYGLPSIDEYIRFGASPRASLYLIVAARAHAFLRKRGYVMPEDIKAIGYDVMRHRVILTYEAEAENLTSDDIIKTIFDGVEIP